MIGGQSWLRKKASRVVDNGRWLMVMMAETWGLWASQPRLKRGNKDKPPFLCNFSLITGHVLLSNILGCMKYGKKKEEKRRHLSKKSFILVSPNKQIYANVCFYFKKRYEKLTESEVKILTSLFFIANLPQNLSKFRIQI